MLQMQVTSLKCVVIFISVKSNAHVFSYYMQNIAQPILPFQGQLSAMPDGKKSLVHFPSFLEIHALLTPVC